MASSESIPQPARPEPPPPPPQEQAPEPEAPAHVRAWRQVKPIIILVAVLFAFRSSVIDWNDVPTGSMNPTIVEGDRILVNKLAYDLKVPFTTYHVATWADPKPGDIVVFFSPEEGTRLVKRCIAVPGDTLEVVNNHLVINGKLLPYQNADPNNFAGQMPGSWQAIHQVTMETLNGHVHPIAVQPPWMQNIHANYAAITLPPGKFFMMGDNRDNSKDSRFFGTVDRSLIVGRAGYVALSVNWGDGFPWVHPRWKRFFSKLP